MDRPSLSQLGDRWYASEERVTAGMIAELRRVRRRAAARPFLTLTLAAFVTGALAYVIVTKHRKLEAEVVLALTEGSMAERGSIHAQELREYVSSVLLSDKNVAAVIEDQDLYRIRKRMGMQYAITELREQLELEVYKNTFLYYRDSESNARKSARIGLTVIDSDPDRAYGIARALADIMIRTHDAERLKLTSALSARAQLMRETIETELESLAGKISAKQTAMAMAHQQGKVGIASALMVDLADLDARHKDLATQLSQITQSRDSIADEITAAGLDVSLEVVSEKRPDRPMTSTFALVLVMCVVATGALLASAMIVSTFDPRVHDADDVARLGLPVLGHVPAFGGDRIGSLRSRGLRRSRSGARLWHSHR
jgi:hypothetical protein